MFIFICRFRAYNLEFLNIIDYTCLQYLFSFLKIIRKICFILHFLNLSPGCVNHFIGVWELQVITKLLEIME